MANVAETSVPTQRNSQVKTLFMIHGWSGVLLGLLLYAVIVTGVVAVFAHEISNWASPLAQRPASALPAGLDRGLRAAAATVDSQYLDEVSIGHNTGERLRAFFHTHRKGDNGMVTEGVQIHLDPVTWQELDRNEGEAVDVRAEYKPSALSRFLIDLHVRLYLPDPWGLLLTGILGLAMMVAAVTGLIVHRHLLRELFVLRLSQRNPLLTASNRHTLAGSWNLLFAFVLAFTGSFFSFAGSFGIPVMAMVAFGGDQEKMIETVVGLPKAEDDSPATLANLDAIINDVRERSGGAEPRNINIQHWGRADAVLLVGTKAEPGQLTGRTFVYDGVSGAFEREKPLLGQVPSAGNSLLTLMGPLHFGDFAGTASQAVWFALGAASAYVVLSGLMLWTRRRQAQTSWRPMARLTVWMGYGLPLALAATACGFFCAVWLGVTTPTAVKGAFLLAALAVSLLTLITTDPNVLRTRLLATCIVLLALTPVLRWLSGGLTWPTALAAGWTEIPALDILFYLGAALCLLALRRPNQLSQTSLQPA